MGAAAGAVLLAMAAAPFLPAVKMALGAVCHQDPARSFAGLPLCARCTGLYAGLLLAALAPVRMSARPALAIAAASLALWLAGVDSNAVRSVLGLSLGWTASCYLITLRLCPSIAPAVPSCRPTPVSAIDAASRSVTNP